MKISDLAGRCGLSTDTIRFYEKTGLLRANRNTNGYRDFPEEAVEMVAFVRSAQSMGFPLRTIRLEMDELFFKPFDYQRVRSHLLRQLDSIDARIGALYRTRARIVSLMEGCEKKAGAVSREDG